MVLTHHGRPLVFQAIKGYDLFMDTSTKKVIPKKRGRRPTGKDPARTFRASDKLMAMIDDWAIANGSGRSEAIRRLVELGLSGTSRRVSAENAGEQDKAAAVPLAPSEGLPDRTQLREVDLPSKIVDALDIAGIETVGALRQSSDEKLIRIALLASKQIRFLRKALGGKPPAGRLGLKAHAK